MSNIWAALFPRAASSKVIGNKIRTVHYTRKLVDLDPHSKKLVDR